MSRQLCECGDWKDDHTILPNQTFCRARGCDCEKFMTRVVPTAIKACERCGGKGHRSEIDKTDGGSIFIVCPICSGSGRVHANGDSLVRDLTLS